MEILLILKMYTKAVRLSKSVICLSVRRLALHCVCLFLQVWRKTKHDRMQLSHILTFSKHESELIAQPAPSCFSD